MLRIAVVGAGHWGPNFIANFHTNDRSRVAWVVDRDEARLEAVRRRFPDVHTSRRVEDALEDPEVDAVVIATPTRTHHELTRLALDAGKHVLVEKPLTDSVETSLALCERAEAAGLVLLVGHVFLYNHAARHVKQCITCGDLGRIYYISMMRTNLGPIRVDVDAAWDLAAHDVSLASYWLDAWPESVSAVGGSYINAGIADVVFATLRYPGEVLVHLHASWLNPRKSRDITVVGERQMLTFDDVNTREPIRIYDKQVAEDRHSPDFVDSIESFRMSVRDGDISVPPVTAGEPLRNECEHFLDCVLGEQTPRSGGREGLAVVRVLDAISRSLAAGGRETPLEVGMTIPLVDLSIQHREIEEEVRDGLDAVMRSGAFILGPAVAEFESAYAEYCEVAHCVGVGNGTDALELALRALEIGPGDEVVLPANSFVASALAVARAGARPVLVDCDSDFHLMDVAQAAERIGSRTRAIMAVDLFGQAAPLAELEELAREAGLALIEDAAQSQGARHHGRAAGSFGDAAGTSFYPGKNLGAYGDAGAVLTRSDELADRVRRLRSYGSEVKYQHPEQGWNSRLDTLQAVVLLAKLRRLDDWNAQRRAAAARYHQLLAELPAVARPATRSDNEHVWHVYAVRVAKRDRVLAALHRAGIQAAVHYPTPIHLQGAFAELGHAKGDFPVAEQAAAELISLPLYPGISAAQQEEVVAALAAALSATRG